MKKSVLSVLILAGVAACSDSSSPSGGASSTRTDKAKVPIIENEDLTPGLRGIDADNNGIRDDIDRLIAKKYSASPQIKKAAQQYAWTLQKALDATTRAQALADGDEIGRAVACIFKVLPARTSEQEHFRDDMLNEISALTANTKERFTTKWKVESPGGAVVYKQPDEPVCD
jgi:hypothetical protein